MMVDIFSSFDPCVVNVSSYWFSMGLVLVVIVCFQALWFMQLSWLGVLVGWVGVILSQLGRTYSKFMSGMAFLVVPLAMVLLSLNLFSMSPYSFPVSSHLLFTLSFGGTLWLAILLSGIVSNYYVVVGALLPSGAPMWLNPFLVFAETISILVRPITLSFRLAANMSAGHTILTLVSGLVTKLLLSGSCSVVFMLILQAGYTLFEFAICLIQAYIFCLLLTLYSDEHPHF